jgi:histidinol-phosphate/aromatic aminotransferase/cobyric acid decarboxylase-like protein
MNFAEFRVLRESIRQEHPQLLDLAETNHVRALGPWLPRVEGIEDAPRAHRCHLAEDWLSLFDLPAKWKSRLCISRGVRHSLSLLLPTFANDGYVLHLPGDVYPVYESLANVAGITSRSFPTLPTPQFPNMAPIEPEALLLPNPLKPLGRFLSGEEVEALKEWLKVDERRRLILDAVYTFDTQLHPTTLELLATGQAIVLHSLSKGWAAPLVLGAALFPETDADAFRPSFRNDPPSQPELQRGRLLLRDHPGLPHRLREVLEKKQNVVEEKMAVQGIALNFCGCPGYLTTVAHPWEEMHQRHGVLAIPASAFGSSRHDHSILSTLAVETSGLV